MKLGKSMPSLWISLLSLTTTRICQSTSTFLFVEEVERSFMSELQRNQFKQFQVSKESQAALSLSLSLLFPLHSRIGFGVWPFLYLSSSSFLVFNLIFTGVTLGGSAIGGIPRIKEMLDLAVEQKITPLIEARPMSELNQASKDMDAGKPRFRYVMVNED